jgi:recombinational DNA repair protein (RecF pathway)
MDILGYRPNTIDCTSCGKPLFEGEIYFSNEGALCPVCGKRSPAAVIVNKASLNAISYILDSDLKEAFSFKLNRETAGYVKRAADMLLLNIDATIISKRMTDEIDEEAIIRKF